VPTRAVFRGRIKNTYVGLVLSERHVALVPPPDNLSGRDPKEGQPEGSLKERMGVPNRNRNRSFFQSGDGSKGPTDGKSNEANFDPRAKGAWLGALERVEFNKNSQIQLKTEKLDSVNH